MSESTNGQLADVLTRTPQYPLLWKSGWLAKHYLKRERTIEQIARHVGCEWGTVKHALVRLGIKQRRYTMSYRARLKRRKGGRARTVAA